MQKSKNTLVLVLCLVIAGALNAQSYLKPVTSDYLRRSSAAIRESHKTLVRLDSAQKTGKFSLAVHHQRQAIEYFAKNDYANTLYHSYRARELAIAVYLINNKQLNPKMNFTANERELLKNYPGDVVVDQKLNKAQPFLRFVDDEFMSDDKLRKLDADDLSTN